MTDTAKLIESARARAPYHGAKGNTYDRDLYLRLADALEVSERERGSQREWRRRWQDPNEVPHE